MATETTSMSTTEFAKAAGVSAASISKLIRDGKLKARKEGGKWMIPQSQLGRDVVRALKGPSKAGTSKPASTRKAPKAAAKPVRPASVPADPASPEPQPERAEATIEAGPAARLPEKTYTIAEFAAMTYLTEKGVAEWLKAGRIKGIQKEGGEWQVLEGNLQVPDISRLLRK
jgi:hypothetical protein